ncbi:MAG TPA: AAA family ATPase [Candidatus Moranbacteria bacterium]|jgi:chromosome segregation protein|nr:AAA family ATPase [Candidatus Moranbacteria bacterium]HPX94407.1 AAA family ATPase [Candidatus Moranbacteria bacterium]HQB59417.1 AAA family ATPase [Candidatus Moranbacteria bacterium]
MYLKKVEIMGFKSFANKAVLEFLPAGNFGSGKEAKGITAIVGPNGSGKSNVADAIKWAMGEQSMKNLRGRKSEDIIFAGSGSKARLSSASVVLHFDNSDKRIPLDFSEVAIARKIFRSGESEYLINGSKVRLIDVIDLLAKAGVGKESYSVINQGMSDAFLNASIYDRRTIIEDAAGVKQYQIKKARAQRKMESTKENMERVEELIREIQPHLRMLKRQAEKAVQGKDIAEKLKEKQIKLFSFLWNQFQSERQQFSRQKETLGASMMNMQREVDKMNDELGRESKSFQDSKFQQELENKKGQLQKKLNEVERELIISEGRVIIEKEKLANQKLIETIPVDLKYVQDKLKNIREAQERLIKRIESVEKLEDLQEIKEHARAIQQQLHDLHRESGKGEISIKKDNSKETALILKKIEEFEEKKKDLQSREKQLRVEIEKIEKEMAAETERVKKTRERFFELERESRVKQEQLSVLKDQFNEAKIKLARIEVREEDLSNEIRSELKCEPSQLKNEKVDTGIDRDAIEKEINKLKMQLEHIGGIDPMIVEEYNETSARFDFLTQELKDLQNAIISLGTVIKEMDARIKTEFEKAFAEIDKEFAKYFKIIFGGGNARLIKSKTKKEKNKAKEDDLNEGNIEEQTEEGTDEKEEMGVDVFACPPGKKISSLAVLSGGERSLTAIALLFAIISYNPPPFAILDEVEAALDEANSRRFGKILQELSASTQFVAITHNRETMRQASLLYGVTMSEDGISKLLSVRLDQVGQGGKIIAK